MPVIIKLSSAEIKAILRKYIELLGSPGAFQAYLQKLYDQYVLDYYNRIQIEQKGFFTFEELDGTTKTGKIRRNGKNKSKTFSLGADCTVSIKMIRFRCDLEHICREVMLNIFVPYSKFLLTDVASILFENNDDNDEYVEDCFFPEQIRYIRRKWNLWKIIYANKLECTIESLEDFFTLSPLSIVNLKRQLFQIRGYVSAFYKVQE